jgi:hypothetical protein
MTTETIPPIEWETPHPSVVALVKPHTRSGIWERLQADLDRVLTEETDDARDR